MALQLTATTEKLNESQFMIEKHQNKVYLLKDQLSAVRNQLEAKLRQLETLQVGFLFRCARVFHGTVDQLAVLSHCTISILFTPCFHLLHHLGGLTFYVPAGGGS